MSEKSAFIAQATDMLWLRVTVAKLTDNSYKLFSCRINAKESNPYILFALLKCNSQTVLTDDPVSPSSRDYKEVLRIN